MFAKRALEFSKANAAHIIKSIKDGQLKSYKRGKRID